MIEAWQLLLLAITALAASTLAGVTGFGGAAILLPVLVAFFGVRDAVPILALAQLVGNGGRVWFNRKDVSYPVVRRFSLGAVPAALIGGTLFAFAPLHLLTRVLGVFLISVAFCRHVRFAAFPPMRLRWFAPLGAATSFLSALAGTVGPFVAPFFLSFGLVKGAYIGTEALTAVVMHFTKLVAYGGSAALSMKALLVGLLISPLLLLGSYLGKQIVDRVSERMFALLIEGVLVVAGLIFLIYG